MLTVQEVRLLERLALSDGVTHAAPGARHAPARGQGLEFRDHRHYLPGDDPRLIDWTIEARLRQLVVRQFRAEGLLRLSLLLDTSASMGVGTPAKLTHAVKVASAIAYVAVQRRDGLGLATFDEGLRTFRPTAVGRHQLFRVLEELQTARAAGVTRFDDALLAFGSVVRGPGLVVILSDFFDVQEPLSGLHFLLHRGLVPALVRVVADEDLDPDPDEEAELLDAEDHSLKPVLTDPSVIREYRRRVAAQSRLLEQFCRERRLPWVELRSGATFDTTIAACQQAGLFWLHS